MNAVDMDQLVRAIIAGWEAAVLTRIAIAVVAVVIVVAAMRTALHRNTGLLGVVLWLLIGVLMILFAVSPRHFIVTIISTEYLTRIRVIMGAVSLLVLFITFESIRSTRLQERYALLWVATGLAILACAFFPRIVDLLRAATGMAYVTAVVTLVFTFLTLVAFHFSISLSGTRARIALMAQRIALLEARLERLETADDGREAPKADPPPADASA